jgi:hypothetical protein
MTIPGLRPGVGVLSIVLSLLILSGISCKQYDYYSPQPGILEVHVKTISRNLEFLPLNNYSFNISNLTAVRPTQNLVHIYEDLLAYKQADEFSYNALDTRTRDSSFIIGQSYVPPGDYIGMTARWVPGLIVVLDGYRQISVIIPPEVNTSTSFQHPFTVQEAGRTKITITVNLDSTLIRTGNHLTYRPYLYISSIQ